MAKINKSIRKDMKDVKKKGDRKREAKHDK
jgi:hypothetical protein